MKKRKPYRKKNGSRNLERERGAYSERKWVRDEWHTVKHRNKEINSKTKPRNLRFL